jgi:hypothetical protein
MISIFTRLCRTHVFHNFAFRIQFDIAKLWDLGWVVLENLKRIRVELVVHNIGPQFVYSSRGFRVRV